MMQLIYVDDASLSLWRKGDLMSALSSFSRSTQDGDYHRLANLVIVKARLQQWKLAERDARAVPLTVLSLCIF